MKTSDIAVPAEEPFKEAVHIERTQPGSEKEMGNKFEKKISQQNHRIENQHFDVKVFIGVMRFDPAQGEP